jgi:Ca-activated chloride channel family protein
MMNNITFANPAYLWLLLIIPLLIVFYILRQQKTSPSLTFSSVQQLRDMQGSLRSYLRHLLFAFRMIIIALLVIIIARPQSTDYWEDVSTEGIDIILAMDISSSMLARDFKPDRLEAAKNVATEFISGRPYDRMGLVIFSGESFTQCPLTTDHAVMINLMREMQSGMIEDGTAIGLGLATAVNRIKDSEAKSKVIILLTDGVNNRGEIAPVTAAEIAKTLGVRVYTIGVGSRGMAPYPVQTAAGIRYRNMQVEIDEEVLKEIATMTGGKYFRATDNESLNKIYEEIDALEKSKINVQEFSRKREEYMPYAIILAALLLLEILLRYTVLRKFI